VLHNLSWTLRPGEFWQLKGPNGSGKSTLLSMIIGDNPKGYGQDMYLFGRKKGSGESIWEIKRQIGYFYPKMTLLFSRNDSVEDMVISGLVDSVGLYAKPTDWQRYVANQWLNVLGNDFKHKKFYQMTSGQQRILLVVRALVKRPPLLILDEPTVGLDEYNTQLCIQLIELIARQGKVAIVYVSHRDESFSLPCNVMELVPGKEGSTAKIWKK
jgi:molybdate transport system ATP-binding protein